MKRKVDYTWRLAELMAARGLHNTTDLIPLLAERDITLSRPQVYRLVNQRPERMSLQVVAALRDIFDRSDEHTSELQSLMRHSYSVFRLKKKQHHSPSHT